MMMMMITIIIIIAYQILTKKDVLSDMIEGVVNYTSPCARKWELNEKINTGTKISRKKS